MAWEEMPGTDRVRSCEHCQQHVFDISQLTRAEAEALIEARTGRLCVRYYQRADGTILLADCTYHEARGGWLPAIVTAAAFGLAVVAPSPEARPEDVQATLGSIAMTPTRDALQAAPVVVVTADGEMLYRGEVLPSLAALDAILATRLPITIPEDVPEELRNAVVVHADARSDAGRVLAITRHLEDAGYEPLFAMTGD